MMNCSITQDLLEAHLLLLVNFPVLMYQGAWIGKISFHSVYSRQQLLISIVCADESADARVVRYYFRDFFAFSMATLMPKLADIQIPQMLPGGNLPHLSENVDRFRTLSFQRWVTLNNMAWNVYETTLPCPNFRSHNF
jgi:hypothetical protein